MASVIVVAYYFKLSIVDELSISLLRIRNTSISYVRPRALSFCDSHFSHRAHCEGYSDTLILRLVCIQALQRGQSFDGFGHQSR